MKLDEKFEIAKDGVTRPRFHIEHSIQEPKFRQLVGNLWF